MDTDPPLLNKDKVKSQKKRRKILGFKGKAALILLSIFLFFMTPLPMLLTSIMPEDFTRKLMSDFYQDITIDNSSVILDEPVKYDNNAPYPVLGRESGVCFKFYSTAENQNADYIDIKRIKNAMRGDPIAEIILMDEKKKQYIPAEIFVSEGADRQEDKTYRDFTVICQKIGRSEIYIPDSVVAIYVRPLEAFRPAEIIWVTQKDW